MKRLRGRYSLGQGFTLVELLVALVLIGLMAVVLSGGLRIGIQTWEKVTTRNEVSNQAFLVQNLLRRVLENAQPIHIRDLDGVIQTAFRGTETDLVFVAPHPRSRSVEELVWISFSLDYVADNNAADTHVNDTNNDNDRGTDSDTGTENNSDTDNDSDSGSKDTLNDQGLIMRTLPFNPNEVVDWDLLRDELVNGEENQAVVLTRGLTDLSFEYLPPEKLDAVDWEPEWLEQMEIPDLIRVHFEASEPNHFFMEEQAIAPRVNAYAIKDAF